MLDIFIADEQTMVRDGIAELIGKVPQFNVVGRFSDGHGLLSALADLVPNVVVASLNLPSLNGVDLAKRILRNHPLVRVFLVLRPQEEIHAAELKDAGICGAVELGSNVSELERIIKTGSRSRPVLCTNLEDRLSGLSENPSVTDIHLTPREREILQLIAEGNTNKEIARILQIGPATVKTHRDHLKEKLGVHETAGLTRQALKLRLIKTE